MFKGWQLLCVLLITFPPSKNFETYLQAFIQKHTAQQEGRVDIMAKYCLRRLVSISNKGPRGKPPMIAEIETASVRPELFVFFNSPFSFLGCCVQPINIRRILRCHHQIARAKLPSSENTHHPSLSRRRHPGAWRHEGRGHLSCSRRQ